MNKIRIKKRAKHMVILGEESPKKSLMLNLNGFDGYLGAYLNELAFLNLRNVKFTDADGHHPLIKKNKWKP